MKNNKSGFTLIELLVVIAIIGLLSTLSLLALNQARARARDTKRISDVRQMQTALEMLYNDTGDYPDGTKVALSNIGEFLDPVPTPPTIIDGGCPGTNAYTYTKHGAKSNATYSIEYCLGSTVNEIPGGSIQTASPAGIWLH